MLYWRDAGAVERGGLENRCPLTGTEGSNPSLSARAFADKNPRLRGLYTGSVAPSKACFCKGLLFPYNPHRQERLSANALKLPH